MAQQSKGNYNALTWLQAELQQSLNLALTGLTHFDSESESKAGLNEAIDALYRAQGSLQMIHLEGATMLVTEMHSLSLALQANRIAQPARAIAVLKTQLSHLSIYLNLLHADFPDHPLCLLDDINDLRRLQGQPALRETDVFQLNLTTTLPDADPFSASPATDELPEPEQFGQLFQASLLTWLSDEADDSLQIMLTLVQQLKQRSQQPASIILWWAAESVLISLQQKTLPVSATNRILLGRLVTPIKRQCEQGENTLVAQLPETLLTELALQVAISKNTQPTVMAFINTFDLRFFDQKQQLEAELERAADNSEPDLSAQHQQLLTDLRQYQISEGFQQAVLASIQQQLQTLAEQLAQQAEYEASNLLHHQVDQIDVLLAEAQCPDAPLLSEMIASVEQVSHALISTPEPSASLLGEPDIDEPVLSDPVIATTPPETGVSRYLQRLADKPDFQQTLVQPLTCVDRYLIQQQRQQSETTVARYLRQLLNETEVPAADSRPLTSVDRYLRQQRQQVETSVARYLRQLLNETDASVTSPRPLTSVDRYLMQQQAAQPMTSVARYIAAQHANQQNKTSLSLLQLLEKTDELLDQYTQQLHHWQFGPDSLSAHSALAQILAQLTVTATQAQQPVLADIYQALTALIQHQPNYKTEIEPLLNRGYETLSQHIEALLQHQHLVKSDFEQQVADYLATQQQPPSTKPFSVMQSGLYVDEAQPQTMPITVEKLTALAGLAGAITHSNRQLITEQTAVKQQIEQLQRELAQFSALLTSEVAEPSLIDRFMSKLSQLQERMQSVQSHTGMIQSTLKQQISLSTQLTDTVEQAQLRPFQQEIAPLKQLVSDIAAQQNKTVQLDVFNANIKLESAQLVSLMTQIESLLVLIVTHSIETMPVREAANKAGIASLSIVLQQHHTTLDLQILTDGLPLQQSELQTHLLASVTEMDGWIEPLSIGELHGVRMTLPLVSSELECLLVEVNNESYALPFDSVAGIERVASEHIEALLDEASPAYHYQDQHHRLQSLAYLLKQDATTAASGSHSTVVILNKQDISLALVVDKVINQQKLIVKRLDRSLSAIKLIEGGAIVDQNKVALLLNLL